MKTTQLDTSLNQLAALRKIVMVINREIGDLDKVVKVILEQACALIGADHGSLMLVHDDVPLLSIAAAVGADWTQQKLACRLAVGEGITGRVAALAQWHICNDTALDPYYYPLFPHVLSEIAVPVASQGHTLGVINLDSDQREAFTPAHAELLTVLAEHAAMAIENARQFARLRAVQEQWRGIFEALPDGLVVCDDNRNVLRVNAAFFRMSLGTPSASASLVDVMFGQRRLFQLEGRTWNELRQSGSVSQNLANADPRRMIQLDARRIGPPDHAAYLLRFQQAA